MVSCVGRRSARAGHYGNRRLRVGIKPVRRRQPVSRPSASITGWKPVGRDPGASVECTARLQVLARVEERAVVDLLGRCRRTAELNRFSWKAEG